MTRYIIAFDQDGTAYLRRTISVTHGPGREGTYTVQPVPHPKRVPPATRRKLLEAAKALLDPSRN